MKQRRNIGEATGKHPESLERKGKEGKGREGADSRQAGISRRPQLADEAFVTELKSNPGYEGIDVDREIGKAKAWLLTPKGAGRRLTRSFLVNWLNKCDPTLSFNTPPASKAPDTEPPAFRSWFSETYPDRSTLSWHKIPQSVRTEFFILSSNLL